MKPKNKLKFYMLFKSIAEDKRLNHTDMLVGSYHYTFFYNEETVYATNKDIAIELGLSEATISRSVTKLRKFGYINESKEIGYPNILKQTFFQIDIILLELLTLIEVMFIAYVRSFNINTKPCNSYKATFETQIGIKRTKFIDIKKYFIEDIEIMKAFKVESKNRFNMVIEPNNIIIANLTPLEDNKGIANLTPLNCKSDTQTRELTKDTKELSNNIINNINNSKGGSDMKFNLDTLLNQSSIGDSLRKQLGVNCRIIQNNTGLSLNDYIAEGKICVEDKGKYYRLFNNKTNELDMTFQLWKVQFNTNTLPTELFTILNAQGCVVTHHIPKKVSIVQREKIVQPVAPSEPNQEIEYTGVITNHTDDELDKLLEI